MKAIRWLDNPYLPAGVGAILNALRLDGSTSAPFTFSPAEWRTALYFCDRHQISLLVRNRLTALLPDDERRRLDHDFEQYGERRLRLCAAYAEMAAALAARGIDWVMLKGMAEAAEYFPDPAARVQYDLDLYTPSAAAASDVLAALGYRTPARLEPATDHLPPMQRDTDWTWQGDFFGERIPIPVEIHFRLWDETMEGIVAPGLELFWQRRQSDGLAPVDALGYRALHLLRHVLRGETRAAHVYELAWFLHQRCADDSFWECWRTTHPPVLRRLEAVSLALARAWFGGEAHAAVEQEIGGLDGEVRRWVEEYGAAPAEALFRPNKDELRLHLLLVDSASARRAILWRRLLPSRLPRTPHGTPWGRASYLVGRALFHLRTLWPALSAMARSSRR